LGLEKIFAGVGPSVAREKSYTRQLEKGASVEKAWVLQK
jgi:hypothetical protein